MFKYQICKVDRKKMYLYIINLISVNSDVYDSIIVCSYVLLFIQIHIYI